MSDLDSVSISAHRRGVPVALVALPLLVVVAVFVFARGPRTARPEPPPDLSGCNWADPSASCRRDGPPALTQLPRAEDLGWRVAEWLGEQLSPGVDRVDWRAAPRSVDAQTRRVGVERFPSPDAGRFVQDDLNWFTLQEALVDPARAQDVAAVLDAAVTVVRQPEDHPWRNTPDPMLRLGKVEWTNRFADVERRRRSGYAIRFAAAERSAWKAEVARWERETQRRRTAEAWGLPIAVGLVFLLPLGAAAGWVLRRRRIEVRCTRSKLVVDGESVALTDLPVDPARLQEVVRALLPPGYTFGPDEHGFGAALERAVAAQHAAEDRPEERARLGALQARTAE